MKKYIPHIIFAILIIAAGVYIVTAKPAPETGMDAMHNSTAGPRTESALQAPQGHMDFGTISMKKGTVSTTYTIKNPTDKPITIERMYTSCMCTTASMTMMNNGEKFGPYGMPGHGAIPMIGKTLEPGEEAEIEVVFDPSAHGPAGVGKIDRSIIIENSDNQVKELTFTVFVTP